jgi:tetratricopeptide (TPR) repeat protein
MARQCASRKYRDERSDIPFPIFLFPIPSLSMRPLIVLALWPSLAIAQDHVHPAGTTDRLGTVSFAVTCAPATQPRFERAVAMLHSFWFDAADRAFADIARSDSTCALAYWGRAMTLMGNPMARTAPSVERLTSGLAFAQRARQLAATASHREQMYADAVLAYYRDFTGSDHAARMQLHEQALDILRQAHPEDMEATIFYARTVVANAPPTDLSFARQIAAGELLQPLFDKHPAHPGLAHYLIHAYDAPATATRGAKAALAYAGIAPDAPHALHMPSHIFTRLGHWDESIATNQRSARAEPDSNAAVHPMDYMVYAYLQQGRERDAKRVVDRAVQNSDRFYGGLLGYNFAAMPARFALERGAWADATSLKLPVGASPYVRAITHFARAIGGARSGREAMAQAEVDSLTSIKSALDRANDTYWATIVEAQRLAVAAWIALGTDQDRGVQLARAAADLEETVEKHPVTPGPLLPARELEGDLLAQLGRHAEALAAYEKTLQREPRRLRALRGAAKAAELAGERDVAAKRNAELKELLAKADRS